MVDFLTYEQNIADLTFEANYPQLMKNGMHQLIAFARDVKDDGHWTEHSIYGVRFPASGNMRTWISMRLSSTINRSYHNGRFLDPNNPEHYLIYNKKTGKIYGPAGCLNPIEKLFNFELKNSSQSCNCDSLETGSGNLEKEGVYTGSTTGSSEYTKYGIPLAKNPQSNNISSMNDGFSLSTCQKQWQEKYPSQVARFLQYRKLKYLQGGPGEKMAMRKCFKNKSYVGRNWPWMLALLGGATYGGIQLIPSNNSSSTNNGNWGHNPSSYFFKQ